MAQRDHSPKLLTAEHLAEMADDYYQFELDEGRLVVMEPPRPPHGRVAARIVALLVPFVEERHLGVVYAGDTGFVLQREPDTVRGPDVAFVRAERALRAEDEDWYYEGAPDLAVEVRSPSDRAGLLAKKVQNYLDTGARLVWVVDPRTRAVVVHAPGGPVRLLGEHDTIDGADVLPGFRAPVAAFFGHVP